MGSSKAIIPLGGQLELAHKNVPALFVDAGEPAIQRFIEFFTANIRNRNTREAYTRAVTRFGQWCDQRSLQLVSARVICTHFAEL
jgi:site-specific recombinase XerD